MSESEQSSGSNILLSFETRHPDEKDGYIVVARDLSKGALALSTETNIPLRGFAMLAAQTLECTLKAYLWHVGCEKEINNHKIRHDLTALWKLAQEKGLAVSKSPPTWCVILGDGHGLGYYFRYQQGKVQGTVVNGGQMPEPGLTCKELCEVLKLVENSISA